MTLDEAITHCHEVAAGASCGLSSKACGLEHKQLGEWLEELQRMRTKVLTRKNVEELEIHEEIKREVINNEYYV